MLNEIRQLIESDQLSGFRGYKAGHRGGPMVQRFEQTIADYFGVKYAIVFNSATAALHSALIACGIKAGDNVIVSPYSFTASASCVLQAGANPLFADIDADSFCVAPANVQALLTANTVKAILPVHLCGNVADMDALKEVAGSIPIIEDAAQALGAKYKGKYAGTIGNCGIFSFNQSKNISTGEGGCLITDDGDIAERAMLVRNHGEVVEPDAGIVGWNYRMTEIEACIGYHRFLRLDEVNNYRSRMAQYITENLLTTTTANPPVVSDNVKHSYYTYAIKFPNDDALDFCNRMEAKGISLKVGYVKPLNLLPAYGKGTQKCPVAKDMWQSKLVVTDIIKEPKKRVEKFVSAAMEVLNVR